MKHTLLDNDCTEAACFADFRLRERCRITYPGACSLEYENIMQILVEELFRWDRINQVSKGRGVLGTVEAFGKPDEEQGRGTLHSHWTVWIKEMSRGLRDMLFSKDEKERLTSREKFYTMIDNLLKTELEGNLEVVHNCLHDTADDDHSCTDKGISPLCDKADDASSITSGSSLARQDTCPTCPESTPSHSQSIPTSDCSLLDFNECDSHYSNSTHDEDFSNYDDIDSHYSGNPLHDTQGGVSDNQYRGVQTRAASKHEKRTIQKTNINPDKILNIDFINQAESASTLFTDMAEKNSDQQKKDYQRFRNARNKILCEDIKGRVARCKKCAMTISPQEIIDLAMKRWRDNAVRDDSKVKNVPYPFTQERLDLWTYRYSYDMQDGCVKVQDPFFGDRAIRDSIMHSVVDMHDWKHRQTCFKKGPDCRSYLPTIALDKTRLYCPEGEGIRVVTWHRLVEGDTIDIGPWNVETKRPMGCQYLNTFCKSVAEVFCCNTNVQIGDRSQVYYCTLYCGKSTQKDDAERQNRMNVACTRRLLRIEDEIMRGERNKDDRQDGFVEGLCRMLSAMNAAQSRDKISVCMQHRLVLNNGNRFQYSHGFGQLLIGQLESRLEGEDIKVRIRYNKLYGDEHPWEDAACDHYLKRPEKDEFENMCAYEMAMHYRSIPKTQKQVNQDLEADSDNEEEVDIDDNEHYNGQQYTKKYQYRHDHPGRRFCHLAKLKKWVVPIVYTPKGYICRIKLLKLNQNDVDDDTQEIREKYAKAALMMFYPFRELSQLKQNNSYWARFITELTLHKNGNETKFWPYGFTILQNIEDRMTMDDEKHQRVDRVSDCTHDETPKLTKASKFNPETDVDKINDILEFCRQDG